MPLSEQTIHLYAEEHGFLLMCRGESDQKRSDAGPRARPPAVEELSDHVNLLFEPETTLLKLGRDLSERQLPNSGSIVVFNRRIGRARIMAAPTEGAITGFLGVGRITVADFRECGLEPALQELLSSGLVSLQSPQSRLGRIPKTCLLLNSTVHVLTRQNSLYIVLVGNAGRAMRMNLASLRVIKKFQSPALAEEVYADVAGDSRGITPEKYADLLYSCIDNNVLEYVPRAGIHEAKCHIANSENSPRILRPRQSS